MPRPSDRDVSWRPLCRKSHPPCRLKDPTVVNMTTCRLSCCKNRCLLCKPAHNPRERVKQYGSKERAARFVIGNYSYETESMTDILEKNISGNL